MAMGSCCRLLLLMPLLCWVGKACGQESAGEVKEQVQAVFRFDNGPCFPVPPDQVAEIINEVLNPLTGTPWGTAIQSSSYDSLCMRLPEPNACGQPHSTAKEPASAPAEAPDTHSPAAAPTPAPTVVPGIHSQEAGNTCVPGTWYLYVNALDPVDPQWVLEELSAAVDDGRFMSQLNLTSVKAESVVLVDLNLTTTTLEDTTSQAKPAAGDGVSETDLLLAFKDSFTNGEELLPSWVNGTDLCAWQGVACSANGFVDRVELLDLGLEGTIPEPDGWVLPPKMTALALGNNRISGPIPAGWKLPATLTTLYFTSNQLSGSLSPDWNLGDGESLQFVLFDKNNLSGPLPEWQLPPRVQSFVFQANRLTGTIPASFTTSKSIQFMDLSNNSLSGPLPPSFSFNTSQELYGLLVWGNNFTGPLPTWPESPKAAVVITPGNSGLCGEVPASPAYMDGNSTMNQPAPVQELPPCQDAPPAEDEVEQLQAVFMFVNGPCYPVPPDQVSEIINEVLNPLTGTPWGTAIQSSSYDSLCEKLPRGCGQSYSTPEGPVTTTGLGRKLLESQAAGSTCTTGENSEWYLYVDATDPLDSQWVMDSLSAAMADGQFMGRLELTSLNAESVVLKNLNLVTVSLR